MEIKDRLKDYRKSKKLSQAEFAASVGISQVALSQYEIGTRAIPDVFIKSVCAVYDLNEEWLRTGEGEKKRMPTIDEELADIFGAFIHDGDPEKKRIAKNILNLIDAIPEKYYPVIAAFVQDVIDKQNEE